MKRYEWVEYTDLARGSTIVTTRLLEQGTWRIIGEKRETHPSLTVLQCAGQHADRLARRQNGWKRRSMKT